MAGPKKSGLAMISSVLGPPGGDSEGPSDAMDTSEADEGGEGELETHLRAFFKAGQGNPRAAAEAFKAAVDACNGYGEKE